MLRELLSLLPNLKERTKQIGDGSLLTNQEWVLYDPMESQKVVWFFRSNNNLEIFKNGIGLPQPGRWEYILNKGVKNSLLTEIEDGRFLLKQAFFDDNFLMLTIDGSLDDYKIFLNQSKIQVELNSQKIISDYIMQQYIKPEFERQERVKRMAEQEHQKSEQMYASFGGKENHKKQFPAQNRWAMAAVCYGVGVFGLHRYMMGYKDWWLMLITLGGFGVWAVIDLIMILTGSLKMADGRALTK